MNKFSRRPEDRAPSPTSVLLPLHQKIPLPPYSSSGKPACPQRKRLQLPFEGILWTIVVVQLVLLIVLCLCAVPYLARQVEFAQTNIQKQEQEKRNGTYIVHKRHFSSVSISKLVDKSPTEREKGGTTDTIMEMPSVHESQRREVLDEGRKIMTTDHMIEMPLVHQSQEVEENIGRKDQQRVVTTENIIDMPMIHIINTRFMQEQAGKS